MTTILIIIGALAATFVAVGAYNSSWFMIPGDCVYQAIWYVTAPPRPNISFVDLSLEDAKIHFDDYQVKEGCILAYNADGSPWYVPRRHYFYSEQWHWEPRNGIVAEIQIIDAISRIPQFWCNGCCGTLRLFVDENGVIKDEKWIPSGVWSPENQAQIDLL